MKSIFFSGIKFIPDYSSLKITAEPGAKLYSDFLSSGFGADSRLIRGYLKGTVDLTGNLIGKNSKGTFVQTAVNDCSIKSSSDENADTDMDTYTGMAIFDLSDPHVNVKWGE